MKGFKLVLVPIFIPFVHDDFASVLIRSHDFIFKLSIPLAYHTNRKPIFSRVLSNSGHDTLLGRDKFLNVHHHHPERSTMQLLFPHPVQGSEVKVARYARSAFPPRLHAAQSRMCLHYEHLANRTMIVYNDGCVRIVDLVPQPHLSGAYIMHQIFRFA